MDDEALRLAVYSTLAATGRAPDNDTLAGELGVGVAAIVAGMDRLAAARHVVLDSVGNVVLAHPFATAPLGFSVMGKRTLWWGGCAWDSFAIPHLVPDEPSVLVSTRCPGCDAALAWVVDRNAPPVGIEVAHFLMPMAQAWDDVVVTCSNQRLFCSPDCVDRWLSTSSLERGYVMDLAALWRLARSWYDGRLQSGYQRREPAQARNYFRDVGLEGPFWGLDQGGGSGEQEEEKA
ncbi:MAG: organomercurial lyase [Sporichthyaceae bacterium]